MSKTSRSNQFAPVQIGVSESISAPSLSSSPTRALMRMRWLLRDEWRCMTTSKRGVASGSGSRRRRGRSSMSKSSARVVAEEARDLVPRRRLDDGGVVAELGVRLEDGRAELRASVSRTSWLTWSLRGRAPWLLGLERGRDLARIAAERRSCTRPSASSHRIEPRLDDARACGRCARSCPGGACRPSITASGRGGQPGTYTSHGMTLSMPGDASCSCRRSRRTTRRCRRRGPTSGRSSARRCA